MNFSVENQTKLAEIEAHLSKHPYLSEGNLPGGADAKIFQSLLNVPDKNVYPNFFFWYLLIKQFSPSVLKSWEIRQEESDRKHLQTQNAIAQMSKRSIKKARSGARERMVFDISFKNEANLEEFVQKLQSLEIHGVDWFKEYKKLPSGQLRVFCMLDEDKTSINDCLIAMEKISDGITITPLDNID